MNDAAQLEQPEQAAGSKFRVAVFADFVCPYSFLAVEQIEAERIATFDAAQQAALVTNLLTVLVSEAPATPMVNVGPASLT